MGLEAKCPLCSEQFRNTGKISLLWFINSRFIPRLMHHGMRANCLLTRPPRLLQPVASVHVFNPPWEALFSNISPCLGVNWVYSKEFRQCNNKYIQRANELFPLFFSCCCRGRLGPRICLENDLILTYSDDLDSTKRTDGSSCSGKLGKQSNIQPHAPLVPILIWLTRKGKVVSVKYQSLLLHGRYGKFHKGTSSQWNVAQSGIDQL